jgi:flagellar hook-associated protein 2
MVLTGKSAGADNAFTVTNGLSGGAGVAFTDTNGNGVSGDSAEDNAVQASNAQLLINNIPVTSASNTLDSVIPGTTLTLYQSDPSATIVVDITADSSALQTKLEAFISAYNEIVGFAADQTTAAGRGDQSSIGRDPVLRQLRGTLRGALTAAYPNSGPLQTLAELGVELQRDGRLSLNQARFGEAIAGGTDHVTALLAGATGSPGALATIKTMLGGYTDSSGILTAAKTQLNDRASRLNEQIGRLEDRLAMRRLALQREFTAADQAMSLLKSQSDSLASFGSRI